MTETTGNAFRAGLVILVGVTIAVAFYIASHKGFSESKSIPLYAYLTDVGGVTKKSVISVAGLQIGEVADINLVPVKIKTLIPDFEDRVVAATGLRPADAAPMLEQSDWDGVVASLQKQDKLPTREEAAAQKLSAADVVSQAKPIGEENVVVARVDFRAGGVQKMDNGEFKPVQIPKDTAMHKDSAGLLGAKLLYLELGASTDMLKSGDRLYNVRSMTDTDALLAQAKGIVGDVRNITAKLDKDIGGITSNINGITHELDDLLKALNSGDANKKTLADLFSTLNRTAHGVEEAVKNANKLIKDNDTQFASLVKNVNSISSDIADLTGKGNGTTTGPDGGPANEGDIRATMASVRKVADDLSVVTGQLKDLLGDNQGEVGEEVKSLKTTINELNRTLSSLSEVAGRVERGEGTVGRLLTDEKIADKVEAAVSGAADYVSSLTSIEAHIDIGTAYNFNRGSNTTTVGLKLVPKPDKFYLIEVVDDGGHLERSTEIDTATGQLRESIREEDNQLRITAMFAKRFFDFLILRVGLIETTGGVGANLLFWDERVELRSDLFDFRGPRDTLAEDLLPGFYLPRWRTQLKAQPIPHLYIAAGLDDVLNGWTASGLHLYTSPRTVVNGVPGDGYGLDYFVGVGLTFKDDDLRSILPFIPGT